MEVRGPVNKVCNRDAPTNFWIGEDIYKKIQLFSERLVKKTLLFLIPNGLGQTAEGKFPSKDCSRMSTSIISIQYELLKRSPTHN